MIDLIIYKRSTDDYVTTLTTHRDTEEYKTLKENLLNMDDYYFIEVNREPNKVWQIVK